MGLLSRFLLDTHTLLWWNTESERLPAQVDAIVRNRTGPTFVSAVSAYEIALKNRIGKLPGVEELIKTFSAMMASNDFEHLPVTAEHAIAAGRLDLRHKDPFDRLLIAQALVENLTLIFNERRFDETGVRRLW